MRKCWGWLRETLTKEELTRFGVHLGFPCGSAGKESSCNVGDLGWIPGLGRSFGEMNGCPIQYSGLENPMDYSPWSRKQSDNTEGLSVSLY